MIVVDDRTWREKAKVKFEQAKDEIKWTTKKAVNWVNQHPAEAIALFAGITTSIGYATQQVKGLMKEVDARQMRRDERCRVWDPVNGLQWYTKRPMTAEQKLTFERRVREGEDRGEILNDMNLLRKRGF